MRSEQETRELVRERYAAVARGEGGCCGQSSCGCGETMAPDGLDTIGAAYEGISGHVAEADLNLGCGVPTRHAALEPGERVLDLGSGAGNDAFIARHEVGPDGHVLGVDMTPGMIAKARANTDKLGFQNVEFREGQLEELPVDSASIDVTLSNCVLNLVPDKGRAFDETAELPPAVRDVAALHVGCVAGAMPEADYLALLRAAGFRDVRFVEEKPIGLSDQALAAHMSAAEIAEFRASGIGIKSVTVLGTRPFS
jgi:arsenite methyltransferase